MVFYIMAPIPDANSGGAVWLYRLGTLLRECGYEVKYLPWKRAPAPSGNHIMNALVVLFSNIRYRLRCRWRSIFYNEDFYFGRIDEIDGVVLYTEVVIGNPYSARNVCRYLLHVPGFFNHNICYSVGELWVQGGHVSSGCTPIGGEIFNCYLDLTTIPDVYEKKAVGLVSERKGQAYSIRKGSFVGREILHDSGAVCIDGMSHEMIAEVFSSVSMFISYDCYSAYSKFAAICGCVSVVVPEPGLTEDQWHPSVEDRYGLAYGLDRVDFATSTRGMLLESLAHTTAQQVYLVGEFAAKVGTFFSAD